MAKVRASRMNTPREYTVTLTEGEVDFLLGIVYTAGGDPYCSPRKYAVRIGKALEKAAGYEAKETDAFKLSLGFVNFNHYGSAEATMDQRVAAFDGVTEALYVKDTQVQEMMDRNDGNPLLKFLRTLRSL